MRSGRCRAPPHRAARGDSLRQSARPDSDVVGEETGPRGLPFAHDEREDGRGFDASDV